MSGYEEQMKLYRTDFLDWQTTDYGICADAYEGKYLIMHFGDRYIVQHKRSSAGVWQRLAEGTTLDEVKTIAQAEASMQLSGRKRWHPEEFKPTKNNGSFVDGADDRVMNVKEWAKAVGISDKTAREILARGDGPPVLQLSPNRIGIRVCDHRAWLAARTRSTDQNKPCA